MDWASKIVLLGSLLGLTTVVFTCLLGQPVCLLVSLSTKLSCDWVTYHAASPPFHLHLSLQRIFYRMARDGLLPRLFCTLSPITGVPTAGTLLTGLITCMYSVFCAAKPYMPPPSFSSPLLFDLIHVTCPFLSSAGYVHDHWQNKNRSDCLLCSSGSSERRNLNRIPYFFCFSECWHCDNALPGF